MNKQQTLRLALIGALTVGASSMAAMSAHAANAPKMEKCYGINAAHKNDCMSPGHSCAGQDAKSRDPNGFVAVPAGLCSKIAGGSTKPAKG
ncbi:MAG: DUF2282 domain-containing protein [Gammaproteobacteria bacterium]|nr:DUF2282 domain-containing protein [Gammaproteobacteria bacterium]